MMILENDHLLGIYRLNWGTLGCDSIALNLRPNMRPKMHPKVNLLQAYA